MAITIPNDTTAWLQLAAASVPSMGSFSICGWAQLDTDRNALQQLFSFQAGPTFSYVSIQTDSDGTSLVIADQATLTSMGVSLTIGTPFFWGLTCSGVGTNTLTGYYAERGALSLTSAQRNVSAIDSQFQSFKIGNNDYGEPFEGKLSRVMLFDTVLSATEMLRQKNSWMPVATPRAWWPMIDTSLSNALQDVSGNSRHLTSAGTTSPTADTNRIWMPPRVAMA